MTRMVWVLRGVGTALGLFAGTTNARQCNPVWLPQPPRAQFDGRVSSLALFEGDLVVGGEFVHAGGKEVNHVARWDGAAWAPLGSGVSGSGSGTNVSALTEFGGDLVVRGQFTVAGAGPAFGIARWNGSGWSAMGTGPMAGYTLLVHGGVLHADSRVWNGSQWTNLGPGVSGGVVFALESYGGDAVAGGSFTNSGGVILNGVARWDGTAWRPLGPGLVSGLESAVWELATWGGDLYATWTWFSGHVSRWDGSAWHEVGSGLSSPIFPSAFAMCTYRDELILAGSFQAVNGVPAANIARWDGRLFTPLGSGLGPFGEVYALIVQGDALVAGGSFLSAGGGPSPYWALWGCPCYPDCNNSGDLTVADFGCFQTQFVAAHPYTDCNSDGAFTVQDFGCFQTKFVAGCP